MPLSFEQYERLGEHLNQLDAPLAEFAARHGYTVYPRFSGGRYPNRRITQEGRLLRSIVVEMDSKLTGELYDQFFPEIPYTLWGGAWIDDFGQRTRWHGPSVSIRGIPFIKLTATFDLHLNHVHDYLVRVTEEYVMDCGSASRLGSST
jgi:hypothetical protein